MEADVFNKNQERLFPDPHLGGGGSCESERKWNLFNGWKGIFGETVAVDIIPGYGDAGCGGGADADPMEGADDEDGGRGALEEFTAPEVLDAIRGGGGGASSVIFGTDGDWNLLDI